jgi:endogenous inhibitor of DNA gyrase (YacG/DUF329 family)
MDLFALVDRVARNQASARITNMRVRNIRFGGDARWPKRSVPEVSYDEHADDEEFAIGVEDLLGDATHDDALAASRRLDERLASPRTREGSPPLRRYARPARNERRRRAPIVEESTEMFDDSEVHPHLLEIRRQLNDTRGAVWSAPANPSIRPFFEPDNSEHERKRAPRSRELDGLFRVFGGRDTLGARSMMQPPTSEKRVAVPIVPYSPPVHVPRRRPRPEDTPLRDGHVGVERFRNSGGDAYSENECSICMEPVTKDATGEHEGFLFGCRHALHRECIADMRKANVNKCPACRTPIQWNISARFNAGPRRRRDDAAQP